MIKTDRVKVSSHPGWLAVRRVVRADELSLADDAVFFLRERVSSWKAEMGVRFERVHLKIICFCLSVCEKDDEAGICS